MGNCCSPASSMEWGGDDWGSLKSKNTTSTTTTRNKRSSSRKVFDEAQHHHHGLSLGNVQKEKLLGVLRASFSSSEYNADANSINGKVNLKISKKELEELLGAIENQQQMKKLQVGQASSASASASAEQVLFRLINARDHYNANKHGRPWKPELESIPEVS